MHYDRKKIFLFLVLFSSFANGLENALSVVNFVAVSKLNVFICCYFPRQLSRQSLFWFGVVFFFTMDCYRGQYLVVGFLFTFFLLLYILLSSRSYVWVLCVCFYSHSLVSIRFMYIFFSLCCFVWC